NSSASTSNDGTLSGRVDVASAVPLSVEIGGDRCSNLANWSETADRVVRRQNTCSERHSRENAQFHLSSHVLRFLRQTLVAATNARQLSSGITIVILTVAPFVKCL